jgi:hypothetical protein
MAEGSAVEGLIAQGREARVTGDLSGAAALLHRARVLAIEQGWGGDEVLSLLIQEAICATDAALFDQAVEALDEFDRLTGPAAAAWATAQARLARAAVLDARAREPKPVVEAGGTETKEGS